MMRLAQCTDSNYLRELAAVEQTLSVEKSILHSPLLMVESDKMMVIKQIIRVVEFFLQVTGEKMEKFQIQVLAGDLRDAFSTDTLDDVILMFKMARKGEFGKVYGKLDHFTIMGWVSKYLQHKSEERERLISLQKRKTLKKQSEISEDAAKKFEELSKRLTVTKNKVNVYSISKALQSMDGYIETLPEACTKLSDSDLAFEIRKTQNTNREAFEILSIEKERRKQLRKDAKNKLPLV